MTIPFEKISVIGQGYIGLPMAAILASRGVDVIGVDSNLQVVAGVKDSTITCLGLSYKANVDDLRESPAVQIVEQLAREGVGKILVVEPHIEKLPSELANQTGVELTGLDEGLGKADMVGLLVDHQAFRNIPPEARTDKAVIDTRGIWG